jgi:YD repeat-containing protein
LFCSTFNDDDGDCPVTAETRITTHRSDPNSGYLSSITDALNRKVVLMADQVGRVTSRTLPDGRQINYNYDENGNTTAITPPSKPVHEFDYTAVDLQQQYTPPAVTGVSQPQTQSKYNLDKQLIQIQRPDGQAVDLIYDSVKKRLNRINLPNFESIRYTYDDSTGQLVTLTAPNGSTLSYTYDGSLALSETWGNGPITGTLTRSYNNDFKVTASSINANPVNYQYDNDGLLTQAGDLSLTRNRQNGLLTATQLGNIIAQRTHNLFGEMASETASLNSDTLYRTEYQRDKLGRITQKAETVEGITTTYNYRYDVAGRLVEVKQDDVVETYSYDDNGNRLSADTASGSVIGNYDDQDRLIQYGNTTYTITSNGELRRKNENGQVTEYNYDVLGNLRSVQLPNGNQIEYVIDARNRRIGKKVNGVLTQAFLYQGSLNLEC